ncbi:hypothetical protein TNCV_3122751 [Trichonephila clavipes]|nr:hypothetical protein TNCV_3122751 [Trichonephila clavipes]
MNQETLDKIILLVWVCCSIRFLFFSYWDIVFLPPLLLLFDAFQNNNNIQGQLSGDLDPEARGHRKQEDKKLKKQGKHTASLDILIQIMIQEELLRIGNKSAECSK